MALRIKEICKQKGLSMSDVADRLCMDVSNLYSSLKGNPSLKRLEEIAKALNVGVGELFDEKEYEPETGIITLNGETYKVSKAGKKVVKLPHYTDYAELRERLRTFIEQSLSESKLASFMGMLETFEVFSLVYEPDNTTFILSICYSDGKIDTLSFDAICEYGDGEKCDIDMLYREIRNDIEYSYSVIFDKSEQVEE